MILVNHNARNENTSAIKIYASFSVLFFFFFFTNSTNSIAHYNKESRFSAFKKGLIQVLGEQKATTSATHLGRSVNLKLKRLISSQLPKSTFFSLHLAKNHNFSVIPKRYKVNKSGRVRFTKQRGTHHFTKHKNITNRRFSAQ